MIYRGRRSRRKSTSLCCVGEQQAAGSRAGRTSGANRIKAGRSSRRRRADQVGGAGWSRAASLGTVALGTKEAGTA
jgi:hypothetical protein